MLLFFLVLETQLAVLRAFLLALNSGISPVRVLYIYSYLKNQTRLDCCKKKGGGKQLNLCIVSPVPLSLKLKVKTGPLKLEDIIKNLLGVCYSDKIILSSRHVELCEPEVILKLFITLRQLGPS